MKEPMSWREAQILNEAKFWRQEARCANHTIGQIYQLVTGAKGEPANWHGAEPVRALVAERDELKARLDAVLAALGK